MLSSIALLVTWVEGGAEKSPPQPPVTVRLPGVEWNYGTAKFLLQGAAHVFDPVNKETLYLGGHNGGAAFGSVGHWALAEDGQTWREIRAASAVLDPLREQALAARTPAKNGEAVARNVFYAAMDADQESAAVKGEPARLINEALRLTGALRAALGLARADGWERDAIARAAPLVEKAEANLKTVQDGFAAGRLDAALLKHGFDAQWALDEAAACLAAIPGPRSGAAAAYDPLNRCVVLFGGDHFDYMLSDTWLYDCPTKTWRQVWPAKAPHPRAGTKFEWSEEQQRLMLSGGSVPNPRFEYYVSTVKAPAGEWTFDSKTGEWAGEAGVAAGTRTYRTVVAAYDPCWYDAAPRGDPRATADWLAKLKPNTWTVVPPQPAPAPERDWGTAVLDPDRDQIYRWTGGHCADPSTLVSTYHPAINRWSIPYVAERTPKGMSFNGRPDCANHTYLHYAYDPLSKRLICTSMGGTGVYNPDIRDFEFSVDQPFQRHIYETCTAGTSKGVVLWGRYGQTWLFDYQAREWRRFATSGERPQPVTDGSAMCYDARRDVLWMATFAGYQKPSGNLWRCDVKTGKIEAMNPANTDTIGRANGFDREIRESIYVPTVDLVLFDNFVGGRQAAYDPTNNRWVLLNIPQNLKKLGHVSGTLVWDPKRELVWNLNSYKDIYVLKIDPQTLTLSDGPSPPAPQPGTQG